jgi:broad specificity phosphatase PhoE
MDSLKKKYIIILRHGERVDDSFIKYKDWNNSDNLKINENDPCLTELGYEQSKSIGSQLKLFFSNLKIKIKDKKISLKTSPFIRTFETSQGMLEGLGIDNTLCNLKFSLKLNLGLYEYLSKSSFNLHPHQHLEIFHNRTLNDSNQLEYAEFLPRYPESIQDAINRYYNVIKKLLSDFSEDDNDLLVIVTHGYGVQVMCEYFNKEIFEVDYCHTFIFLLKQNLQGEFLEVLTPNI